MQKLIVLLACLGVAVWLFAPRGMGDASPPPTPGSDSVQAEPASGTLPAEDEIQTPTREPAREILDSGSPQEQSSLGPDRVALKDLPIKVQGYLHQGVKERYCDQLERIMQLAHEHGAHRENAEIFTRAVNEFEAIRSSVMDDETEALEAVKSYYQRYPDPEVCKLFEDEETLDKAYESALEKFEASKEAYDKGQSNTLAPYPVPDVQYGLGDNGDGVRCALILADLGLHVRLKGSVDYAQVMPEVLQQGLRARALSLLEGINL